MVNLMKINQKNFKAMIDNWRASNSLALNEMADIAESEGIESWGDWFEPEDYGLYDPEDEECQKE